MNFRGFFFSYVFVLASIFLIDSQNPISDDSLNSQIFNTSLSYQIEKEDIFLESLEPPFKKKKLGITNFILNQRFEVAIKSILCEVLLTLSQKYRFNDFTLKFIQSLTLSPPV